MCYLLLLVLLPIAASELCEPPEYHYYMCQNNTLSCPDNKRCAFIEHCPAIASLMDRDELPVHRCSVLVGEYNTESDPDCNELFCGRETSSHDISYVIKHPGYDAATFSNNVALLRLKKTIDFTATAQPICFIPEDRYVSLGSTCTVVGWGRLSGQKAQPTTQQSLQLKLVPKQQCSDYLNQGLSVELCATGSCEPCSGYSGSPMLYKYADTYFLVGILSYGSSCDSTTTVFPSAFVNVQRYTKWILENY